METYNISYLTAKGIKKHATMSGFDATDVRDTFNSMTRIDNNEYFDCRIVRVWQNKPSTPKQRLAQKYGFIMGGIKGAKVAFNHARGFFPNGIDAVKTNRAISLVDSQFSKLQRDIADVFKLAGLKIK